ncbi:MAG: glycine cleavage system protein H [Acidimicrobiia bacterium]
MATIKGFEVRPDLSYDFEHHMWVEELGGTRVRIGMDSLGVETSGTLAHLMMVEPGTEVARGEPFGSLEAEKYVGPLVAPLSGRVVAVNGAVLSNPAAVQSGPYRAGWLIELEATNLAEERSNLVTGEDEVKQRFAEKVVEYRLEGVIAE